MLPGYEGQPTQPGSQLWGKDTSIEQRIGAGGVADERMGVKRASCTHSHRRTHSESHPILFRRRNACPARGEGVHRSHCFTGKDALVCVAPEERGPHRLEPILLFRPILPQSTPSHRPFNEPGVDSDFFVGRTLCTCSGGCVLVTVRRDVVCVRFGPAS